MKKLIFSLLVASALLVSFAFGKSAKNEEPEESEPTSNLIKNGDFSKGKKFWDMFLSNGSADQLVTENGEMEIRIKNPGPYEYESQPYFEGFSLYKGGV